MSLKNVLVTGTLARRSRSRKLPHPNGHGSIDDQQRKRPATRTVLMNVRGRDVGGFVEEAKRVVATT